MPVARRAALAAQGLHRPPRRPARRRDVLDVVRRIGLVQVDSVNVLTRAHYLPVFSRVGPYETRWLDEASGTPPRTLVEYWGHEASLIPAQTHPLLRWRMERADQEAWGSMRRIADERPSLVDAVLRAVADEGPVTAAELERHHGRAVPEGEHWGWQWSEVKRALEYLFWSGKVTAAGRGTGFERRYDVPERVLPHAVLATPTPAPEQAITQLVAIAAAAHGVATEADLRDYFRLPLAPTRAALATLVGDGTLRPVRVPGWTEHAYLHRDAVRPRRADARALLAPFDPLVWTRPRVAGLFGFRYRLEIYVPAAQRVHGYYVLPFLLRDRFAARVDLKADRSAGVLVARSAWVEEHAPPDTAGELGRALTEMAQWLGLGGLRVEPRGDLADDLQRHLPC